MVTAVGAPESIRLRAIDGKRHRYDTGKPTLFHNPGQSLASRISLFQLSVARRYGSPSDG
jgi:hypothetical protein